MGWLSSSLDSSMGLQVEICKVWRSDDIINISSRRTVASLLIHCLFVNRIETNMVSFGHNDRSNVDGCCTIAFRKDFFLDQLEYGVIEHFSDTGQFIFFDLGVLAVTDAVAIVENIPRQHCFSPDFPLFDNPVPDAFSNH